MRPLVVLVNLTKFSVNTIQYAADLALAMQVDIHLLCVRETSQGFEGSEDEDWASLTSLRNNIVRRTRGKLLCPIKLQQGSMESRLKAYCQRVRPFAVVMGREDEHSNDDCFFNHIATAVLHNPYPSIIIPVTAKFRPIRKVVLACEPAKAGKWVAASMPLLREIKASFHCSFDIVCVGNEACVPDQSFVYESGKLKDAFRELDPDLHFVNSENSEESIRQYVVIHNFDWIMLFPADHSTPEFHSGKDKRIIASSPVPIFALSSGPGDTYM
jgi:hypothetical protein